MAYLYSIDKHSTGRQGLEERQMLVSTGRTFQLTSLLNAQVCVWKELLGWVAAAPTLVLDRGCHTAGGALPVTQPQSHSPIAQRHCFYRFASEWRLPFPPLSVSSIQALLTIRRLWVHQDDRQLDTNIAGRENTCFNKPAQCHIMLSPTGSSPLTWK